MSERVRQELFGKFGTYVLGAWRPFKREAIVDGLPDQLVAGDALDVQDVLLRPYLVHTPAQNKTTIRGGRKIESGAARMRNVARTETARARRSHHAKFS